MISKHAFKISQLYKMISDKPWTDIILYKGLPYRDELTDISQTLEIKEYNLSHGTDDKFYKGKALLVIKPTSR